ncbi:MalY/PatB family protein [Fusobacterium sp. IOR10]|uniref:MalY/PatB family protein n=1 Tax=Fusobacterium sp. IOR10 TaxID=2665157 RepID=UPI0013D58B3D|nr:MalY/PatB family protein [Fusobacterium sp. IOR10]
MSRYDEIICRFGTNSAKWDEHKDKLGEDVLELSVADMDFKSPKEILDKMLDIVNHGIFGYTILPDTYYKSTIDWYKKRHDYKIEKDWIIYSPRVGIGANIIVKELTNIGDDIIVNTPAYPTLTEVVLKNNRNLIESPLILRNNRYEIDFDNLEKVVTEKTKIFMLCNPHNPTGRVFSNGELLKIVEFCKKYDLYIISDEIHCDLTFPSKKHIPICSVSKEAEERSIICSSITKTFNVPGIITSNLIIPNKEIREKILAAFDRAVIHNPNIFGAAITEVAYNDCEYWLNDTMEYTIENRNYLNKYLEKYIPKLKLIDSEGTYLAWVNFENTGIDDDELQKLFIEKARVNVYMGSHFGEVGKGYIRVNLATPRKNIEKFLKNIEKSLNIYYNKKKEGL